MSNSLPVGTELFCEVFYKTIYVVENKIEESSEIFKANCLLVGLDMITGSAVAVSQLQTARELMWRDWNKFRKDREKPREIDQLVIVHTEYWTDMMDNRDLVTEFIDRHIRSIPGYANVPARF